MNIFEPAAGTPYENGVFRMKLILSHDFPHSPPKGLSVHMKLLCSPIFGVTISVSLTFDQLKKHILQAYF